MWPFKKRTSETIEVAKMVEAIVGDLEQVEKILARLLGDVESCGQYGVIDPYLYIHAYTPAKEILSKVIMYFKGNKSRIGSKGTEERIKEVLHNESLYSPHFYMLESAEAQLRFGIKDVSKLTFVDGLNVPRGEEKQRIEGSLKSVRYVLNEFKFILKSI